MIQVLVTIGVVILVLFILVLLLCVMVWAVTKLLRFLFPDRFHGSAVPAPKLGKKKKSADTPVEHRCGICDDLTTCPAACSGVAYPCVHFKDNQKKANDHMRFRFEEPEVTPHE